MPLPPFPALASDLPASNVLASKVGIARQRMRRTWGRVRSRRVSSRVTPAALRRSRRVAGDRLLQRPVFILSSVRSGSTLLRVMLDTHSQLHAPHELHLIDLDVSMSGRHAEKAMRELGIDDDHLQYLLWDRLLHREMVRHGKSRLVNKTPSDVLMWPRILECWPDAQFIYLLRHPAAVTDSWNRNRSDWSRERAAEDVRRYMAAMEDARARHPGLTVRYEQLVENPEHELTRICAFIGVQFEPSMLEYGEVNHGRFPAGLGDWSSRIKSGRVQPIEHTPTPDEIPSALSDISAAWGYTV